RRRHTRCLSDWSSDVCSSDLIYLEGLNIRCTSLVFGEVIPCYLYDATITDRVVQWCVFDVLCEVTFAYNGRINGVLLRHVVNSRSEERRVGGGGRVWYVRVRS